MLKTLLRAGAFIIGIVLLCDIVLPTRTETVQVDRHSSHTQRDVNQNNGFRQTSTHTEYKLQLVGGQVLSCTAGYSAYTTLQDGDAIEVQTSRLFKSCVRITRGHDTIQVNKYWRLLEFGGSVLAMLVAFGLGTLDRFGNVRFGSD